MLDINFIRENPDKVKENIKKKDQLAKLAYVDSLIKEDKELRNLMQKSQELRHKRNTLSQEVAKAKKQGKDVNKLLKEAKDIPNQIKEIEYKQEELQNNIQKYLQAIPNIMHPSVPKGKDDSENVVRKKEGKPTPFKFPVKNHVELMEDLNLVDFDASAKVAGNGFYYLKGDLGLLNQALIQFTIDFMHKKKYTYIEPPLMVSRKVAAAAGDLTAFETALYKIEGEDAYMIPTAEHAILGMLTDRAIPEEQLPLKFFGYSMCFRKEIGSHGINEKGLWRTHQFNKVEQFIFCKPEDSWKFYDELKKNTEEIVKKLKLPYRIIECCTGDLGDWKAKSEDVEVYRPTTEEYGETMSLSNCTDYQTRPLNIKGMNKKGEKYILHSLNNTAVATSRIMVAILENYQQKDGSIKIPTVLQKYMGGKKVIKKA